MYIYFSEIFDILGTNIVYLLYNIILKYTIIMKFLHVDFTSSKIIEI